MSTDPKDTSGLGSNPFGDDPLATTFYGAAPSPEPAVPDASTVAARPARKKKKPTARQPLPDGKTWRLVTFSFYEEDVDLLDKLLAEAKARGVRRVSRSQIVRYALSQVDISKLPKGQ